jgi:hypothetical protein
LPMARIGTQPQRERSYSSELIRDRDLAIKIKVMAILNHIEGQENKEKAAAEINNAFASGESDFFERHLPELVGHDSVKRIMDALNQPISETN